MTSYLIMTQCDHGAAYAEVDQFCSTLTIARREARNLSRMGCGPIRIYEFADEGTAQDYTDEKDNRYPSTSVAKLISTIA